MTSINGIIKKEKKKINDQEEKENKRMIENHETIMKIIKVYVGPTDQESSILDTLWKGISSNIKLKP